jgi:uncharacterized protein (TIGR01777 family)
MRVIITGGTGLIGKALAGALAKDGHEVVVLTRSPEKAAGLPTGVRAVKWDAQTGDGWVDEANGAGAIVNLAGESIAGEGFLPSRWTSARKKRIVESRINAGNAVVDAVRRADSKPGVVIQASAIGYYGTQDETDTSALTEDAPPGDDFLAEVCMAWEPSTAEVEVMGVRRAVIRTGLVLTFKGGLLPKLSLPFQFFAGGPIGSGKQVMSWLHFDDQIKAIRFLIETPTMMGAFNVSAPNPVTNAQFGKTLGKVMGRPSFIPAPGFAFKAAFGELADVTLLRGQRVVPAALQAAGFEFDHPELEAALRDLY